MNMLCVSKRSALIRAFERTNIHGHTIRSSKNFREKRVFVEKNPFSYTFLHLTFLILLMHVRKNFSKTDFFRFFEKCAKSCLNIIYGLETGFKHFGGDFDAIFDDLYII